MNLVFHLGLRLPARRQQELVVGQTRKRECFVVSLVIRNRLRMLEVVAFEEEVVREYIPFTNRSYLCWKPVRFQK
jgi:hypothetical protein